MTDFISHARAYGVLVEDMHPSSRIRRCGTVEHPRGKSGAYFWDGERGWVQAWDGDGEIYWYDDPARSEPTQADRDEWARRKLQREAEQLKLWGSTAIRCRMLMDTSKLGEHNYLHRRGLGHVLGNVLPDGELIIPMYNVRAGALVGAQLISWCPGEMKFNKKFVHGSRLKESAMRIGPQNAREIILCEGFATGHSIDAALRQLKLRAAVIVCFNDSNMVTVSKLIKADRVYVFADNDKSEAGESAAQATGLSYCMSPNLGEDANDLHKRAGLMPLCSLIMTARRLKETA